MPAIHSHSMNLNQQDDGRCALTAQYDPQDAADAINCKYKALQRVSEEQLKTLLDRIFQQEAEIRSLREANAALSSKLNWNRRALSHYRLLSKSYRRLLCKRAYPLYVRLFKGQIPLNGARQK